MSHTCLARLRLHTSSPGSAKSAARLALPRAHYSSAASMSHRHKVLVVGAGAAGLSVSHQLLRSGKFAQDDIAVVDPADWHHYQPGWTLVGAGLKDKNKLKMRTEDLIHAKLKLYNDSVGAFTPQDHCVTLETGTKIQYDHLVVCPGINIKYDSIKGLPEALANPDAPISTTYGYHTCDKVYQNVQKMKSGVAIFTQPTGIVKCAGAPQKAMWLALDYWKRAGLYRPGSEQDSSIKVSFATGLPVMFGVAKYSATLDQLRRERGVEGLFQHDLVSIDGNQATFVLPDGKQVARRFDFLHVVPKMGPHAFVANSPLADAAGLVDVDSSTMRHRAFSNVWSLGDASNLPTSKTAAAITAQAPVLVSNLLCALEGAKTNAVYDGYTSCPLTTEYGKVLLAEFKYGGEPKETFGKLVNQAVPGRGFYYLKKDFFPWVYKKFMVKGAWGGPKGFIRQR
ncbi:NAD(FAD)-dependent dehydrogenase domain protein [Metarhizium robertsii]|uniref:Sulfide quinone-reductase n=2 Tax=Metarhizium robertsii TaxID=568076 RepID=E9FBL4_METRA|nr:sulfide quinone-reductase [Metarhizium robertsii ARSEF 23]EFY94833.1 sulfide quinone-reductase [Metarhizium robertsii ARSEF 23]EXU96242.1 NAD(FAD)-dependent dehydrogenase domain protein [Metarhizium robertsii]